MTYATLPAPDPTITAANPIRVGPIIAAVGGTDPDSVLRAARMLAPSSSNAVVAVSVLPPLPVTVIGDAQVLAPLEYEEERYEALKSALAARLSAFGGPATSWPSRILCGAPAFALTELAREMHASLLVMGIGRHRALDRILGAETTLRAIRRASCPVLVVHPDLDAPFHDVVVATDFSPASANAARAVLPLLGPSATVHIVHVWEPSGSPDAGAAAADDAYAKSLPERFERLIGLLAVPGDVTIKQATREGKAAARVLDYAAAHHADLIVAGRHGHNLRERLLVGSQTAAMVRGANRSLLIAPEPPVAVSDPLELRLHGSTRSTDPEKWATELRALSERSNGRPTIVEVRDLMFGAEVIESGYVLLGAAYDPASRKLELSLGDATGSARRVTRVIGTIDAIEISTDAAGRDRTLRISHGGGQTTLTFLGD